MLGEKMILDSLEIPLMGLKILQFLFLIKLVILMQEIDLQLRSRIMEQFFLGEKIVMVNLDWEIQ